MTDISKNAFSTIGLQDVDALEIRTGTQDLSFGVLSRESSDRGRTRIDMDITRSAKRISKLPFDRISYLEGVYT